MIGEGMAVPQRAAAEFYLHALTQSGEAAGIEKLVMNTFPAQGLTSTYAYNSIITAST